MTYGSQSSIELTRDCQATLIPGGAKIVLSRGDEVMLTQALGGNFTVTTSAGYLARIASIDADALGLESAEATEQAQKTGEFDMDEVYESLKTIYDPEIPVNIVDLGLIYECNATPLDGGGMRVEIKMTMTAPGCGMGDVLSDDARDAIRGLAGVGEVDIELVWDPPWDMTRMSEAARLELGMY